MTRARDFADANFPNRLLNKNVVIGGDFSTNPFQRGTSKGSWSNGTYGPDRWFVDRSGAGNLDYTRVANAPTAAQAGVYSSHCLEVGVETEDTSIGINDYYTVRQHVEGLNVIRFGFGQAGTRYVVLGFWHAHTVTGTYCVAVHNDWGITAGNARAYIAEYTQAVADAWEFSTVIVPVDTGGTWKYDTNIGLTLIWSIAAGTNAQGTVDTWNTGSDVFATANQVNGMSSTSNKFRLQLIQLEEGQVATAFEQRTIQQELALCLRYYVEISTSANHISGFGYVTAATTATVTIPTPVPLRALPTLTSTDLKIVTQANNLSASSPSVDELELHGVQVSMTIASSTTNRPCILHCDNATAFDAEL